jgi:hypothetical protein
MHGRSLLIEGASSPVDLRAYRGGVQSSAPLLSSRLPKLKSIRAEILNPIPRQLNRDKLTSSTAQFLILV